MDSSNLQETLEKVDQAIAQWQADIEKGKALARLKKTPDFQLVFMEGYIDTEAKKLFEILTDPTGASCYSPEQIHLRLEAISHFKSYVGTEKHTGTVETDALYAPNLIDKEREYRKQVTADAAKGE